MTKDEIEQQMVRFEQYMGIFFSYTKEINIYGNLDYAEFSTKLVFTGWLAAKQDAKQ